MATVQLAVSYLSTKTHGFFTNALFVNTLYAYGENSLSMWPETLHSIWLELLTVGRSFWPTIAKGLE